MLRRVLFYQLESFTTGKLGPWLRRLGQSMVAASEARMKASGPGHTDERK